MLTDLIGLHSVLLPLFIKTITKFSNVISYHQRDLSTNRTVCASCLYLDNVIGQLTSHACVSGQNASCARVVVSHFAELIHCNFFFYENVSPMSSLSQILS